MHKMSSLEYSFVLSELAPLSGKHFSRLRQLHEGAYRFKVGSGEIMVEAGIRMHLTRLVQEPIENDRFVEKVEKELAGSRLVAVRQIGRDRIISLDFDKGSIICEMFGKGNIVFVRDGKTVCAYKYESWSDREIKAGKEYRFPKSNVSDALVPSGKYIIVDMMRLPLGKEYAAEILSSLGIPEKTPGTSLSGNQITKIEDAMRALVRDAKPYVFFNPNGSPADFALAPLSSQASKESRGFPTLSEAADEYYSKMEKADPMIEKLESRLAKQGERMEGLVEEEERYRKTADFIYSNYNGIEKLLEKAKKGELEKWTINKKERSVELDF